MATYASLQAATDYLTSLPEGDQFTDLTEQELDRAEADINRLPLRVAGHRRNAETGLKLDPPNLMPYQERALMEATADQLRFRRLFGENSMALPQYDQVTANGLTRSGKVDKFSEEAYEKLVDAGLIPVWTKSGGGRDHDASEAGWTDVRFDSWRGY